MTIRKQMRLGFAPAFLILALTFTALADTLRLKDGGIIKGRVIGFDGGSFVVSVGEGSRRRELRFAASDVESVQFEAQTESSARSASPSQPASYRNQEPDPKVIDIRNSDADRQQSRPSTSSSSSILAKPQPASANMKPVEFRVKVLADNTSNGWTNSGWVVRKGQKIRIVADNGTVSLGKGKSSTAAGESSIEDDQKLLRGVPTGALIAVIGDDNNDFIYIGSEREFTATRDGALFLGINDGDLKDNSGALHVKVEILPDKI